MINAIHGIFNKAVINNTSPNTKHLRFNGTGATTMPGIIPQGQALIIEFWQYLTTAEANAMVSPVAGLFSYGQNQEDKCQCYPYINNQIYFQYGDYRNDNVVNPNISAVYTSYLDKWTHVAFVADDNYRAVYLDGVLKAEKTSDAPYPLQDVGNVNSSVLMINSFGTYFPNQPFYRGAVDEYRLWFFPPEQARANAQAHILANMNRQILEPETGLYFCSNFSTVLEIIEGLYRMPNSALIGDEYEKAQGGMEFITPQMQLENSSLILNG